MVSAGLETLDIHGTGWFFIISDMPFTRNALITSACACNSLTTNAVVGVTTFGGSAVGSVSFGDREADWLGWFVGQSGDWYGQTHRAWSFSAEAGEGSADFRLGPHWSINGFAGSINGGSVVRNLFAGHWLRYVYLESVIQY